MFPTTIILGSNLKKLLISINIQIPTQAQIFQNIEYIMTNCPPKEISYLIVS